MPKAASHFRSGNNRKNYFGGLFVQLSGGDTILKSTSTAPKTRMQAFWQDELLSE